MKVIPSDTKADQWQSQILARVMMKHTVIVVTRPEMREIVEGMTCGAYNTTTGISAFGT